MEPPKRHLSKYRMNSILERFVQKSLDSSEIVPDKLLRFMLNGRYAMVLKRSTTIRGLGS